MAPENGRGKENKQKQRRPRQTNYYVSFFWRQATQIGSNNYFMQEFLLINFSIKYSNRIKYQNLISTSIWKLIYFILKLGSYELKRDKTSKVYYEF